MEDCGPFAALPWPAIIISRQTAKRQPSARPIASIPAPEVDEDRFRFWTHGSMSMFILTLWVGSVILPRPDQGGHLGLPTRTRRQHGCGSCPVRPPGRTDGPAGTNDLQGRGWPAERSTRHHTPRYLTTRSRSSEPTLDQDMDGHAPATPDVRGRPGRLAAHRTLRGLDVCRHPGNPGGGARTPREGSGTRGSRFSGRGTDGHTRRPASALLDLLRQAYRAAAEEAQAHGRTRDAELYRDNLEILIRKHPTAQPSPGAELRPLHQRSLDHVADRAGRVRNVPDLSASLPETAPDGPVNEMLPPKRELFRRGRSRSPLPPRSGQPPRPCRSYHQQLPRRQVLPPPMSRQRTRLSATRAMTRPAVSTRRWNERDGSRRRVAIIGPTAAWPRSFAGSTPGRVRLRNGPRLTPRFSESAH